MLTRRRSFNILMAIIIALTVLTVSCQPEGTPPPTQTEPPQTQPSQTQPVTLTPYENTEQGFSIEYPQGWIRKEQASEKTFGVEFTDAERSLAVYIYVESRPQEITLANSISESKEYLRTSQLRLEPISEGNITISNGVPGYEMVYRATVREKVEKFRYIMLVREKQSFSITVSGQADKFDQWQQLTDSMLSSFKLLSTYTASSPIFEPTGTYTDTRYGFSVSYPLGWFEVPTGRPGHIVSFAYSEDAQPGVTIALVPVDEGTTLAGYVPQLTQDLSQNWVDYMLISEGEIALRDGTLAYEIVFSGSIEGRPLECKYVIVIRGTEVFLVMGFTTPGRFEQDEKMMDRLLYSFHLEQ